MILKELPSVSFSILMLSRYKITIVKLIIKIKSVVKNYLYLKKNIKFVICIMYYICHPSSLCHMLGYIIPSAMSIK